MMKKGLLAAVVATALFQSPAHAGLKEIYPLLVFWNEDGSLRFMGALGSVRSSANPGESIGCTNSADADGVFGACYATYYSPPRSIDVSCYTFDPNMVAAIRSVGTDSYVHLDVDAEGRCTLVHVQTMSELGPKTP